MTFARVIIFSLFSLLAFTIIANLVPQVQGDPPVEEKIDTGSLDMAGMIALGERLFTGKGTCTLCHNNLGRAPDLLMIDLSKSFPARLADPRYNGISKGKTGAKAVEDYILESMKEPSKYVVAGFGKKGSNDTVSPMPKVDAAPIELSPLEMNAIAAFLQDKAGYQPTVALPSANDVAAVADKSSGDGEEEGPATTGKAAVEKFGCPTCHDLEGSGGDIGPDLRGIGKRMDDSKIVESIVNPNAVIAKGFEADTMPDDFSEQMRVSELNLIVDYLKNLPEQK
ncbi:MAG TPA: c-type cytochrome [Rhizobiales bacterium]|nr:c-type cytochrome [Hyphomicrobiales bacterium]